MSSKVPVVKRQSKVRPVPIPAMRTPTVDVIQRRFDHKQSERYAADFDFEKLGWPIVNHRDGNFWLVDGQHRVGALKLLGLGQELLDCEVYEDLTDAQMAHIFLGRDDRRRIDTYTKFNVACTANHPRETEVRRMVEAQHLKVSRRQESGCVGAVASLLKVFDASGSVGTGTGAQNDPRCLCRGSAGVQCADSGGARTSIQSLQRKNERKGHDRGVI